MSITSITSSAAAVVRLGIVVMMAAVWALPMAPAAASDGENAFKNRCGGCHGAAAITAWGRRQPETAARAAWLDRFLRRHYPPSDAERALIVGHIQATIAAPPRPQ